MGEGDISFIRESDIHRLRGKNLKYFNLNFYPKDFEGLAKQMGLEKTYSNLCSSPLPPLYSVPPEKRRTLLELFDKLFINQNNQESNYLVYTFLVFFLAEIIAPPTATITTTRPSHWIDKMHQLIVESKDIISVSELPSFIHKSPEHISRTCKKILGISPSELINQERLRRAELLLAHTNEEIIDIAHRVGYNNLTYFYTTFKKKYNQSPRQYRLLHSITWLNK